MSASIERFAELVSRDQFALAEACLLVAQDEYPGLDVGACIDRIEAIAATVRGRLAADATPEQKVAAVNRHLFAELGFRGNAEAYYDPRNSYLNQVLERRVGIPISLSVVYLEVARRVGFAAQGIAFPGHFLVKVRLSRGTLVLDPFGGGTPQSEADLRERLEQALPRRRGAAREELDAYLDPATAREIVARVLRNLKSIYLQRGALESALAVMQRMLLVVPESAEELRDRGLLYARLECFRPAAADLQSYLRRCPDAPDAAEIHAQLATLRGPGARLH
jgi:regulator of sirC expression with transglutaminase-like and TPR domain